MSGGARPNPKNIISVDVEEYYQVEAFADMVSRSEWETYPSRVEANTYRVLDLMDRLNVKGTFFILGWVAERFPALVREIVSRGHEPACHSYWHRLVFSLSPEEFRQDTVKAKDAIEQAAGMAVFGYRAPSFSITNRSAWALGVLAELGFQYDSSVFPIRHDTYGVPDAPRSPFRVTTPSGPITEYPMSTFRLGTNANLPVAGGGYLRIFPFWYTRFGVRRAWREGLPIISYIHPWEFDPEQPRIAAKLKSRLRHYTNLSLTAVRLEKLLQLGDFGSFRDCGLSNTQSTGEYHFAETV
jgi:polysaccharide deacetylase family protein (PEP-CTERM system associated)